MLGLGIYHLDEVSAYTGIPKPTLRSWFKPRSDHVGRGPVFASDYRALNGDYAVSFLNLIDAYVLSFFRKRGVKPAVIRRAYTILQAELHTTHPFAHADLCTDGNSIIRESKKAGRINLIDVIDRQMVFSELQPYMDRIDYGSATRLAEAWRIANGVVIRPTVGFGKPVIENTGISTYVIANQFKANKRDAGLVARLFDIAESDVVNAVEFEAKYLRHRLAA
ncbi:MAG: DUF433 domain-containing protein [Tepidisphaeraceae bacterium]